MARYVHLPLPRLEGSLPRSKRGGGGPPFREHKVHGKKIQQETEAVIAENKKRPDAAVDPSCILKIQTTGAIDEKDWNKLGMTILASDANKAVVLFSSDGELREFRNRVEAYQLDTPQGQKHPRHNSFVASIVEVSPRTAKDRIGPALVSEGLKEFERFQNLPPMHLDVELWQPTEDMTLVYIDRIERCLANFKGKVISQFRGSNVLLLRVEAGGEAIQAMLNMVEVATIDVPPQADLPDMDVSAPTVGDFPAAKLANEAALTIGIVDSGISAEHPLLANVVVGAFGEPTSLGDDDEKNHGTPVSGVAVYGDIRQRIIDQNFDPNFRIASAKVVDKDGHFSDRATLPTVMNAVVRRLHQEFGCKVINISLADIRHPVDKKASPWASTLDTLARELDLVIVVSAGNSKASFLSDLEDSVLAEYPKYLLDDENRILEPASAAIALTVGSIAYGNGLASDDAAHVHVRSFTEQGHPSPFTRAGPGVAKIIKPDLVDYGGTLIYDGAIPGLRSGKQRPAAGILSLNNKYVDQLFCSPSGTSLASALVAYKAALLRDALPDASANLTRALLALSASHPETALDCLKGLDAEDCSRILGYGLSDVEAAASSDDNRVILYQEGSLGLDMFAVYEIPLPEDFQNEAGEKQIRVALAFDPPVRGSRNDYLGVTMGFHLIRGASPTEVFNWFRSWKKTEGKKPKLPGGNKCPLFPGSQMREHGTLQCATHSRPTNMKRYRSPYYLVVRCESGWADVAEQKFAVAVQIKHEAQIKIYDQIAERVKVRE